MALPATDNFTGSDGTPLTTYSSNWSLNSGNFEINTASVRSNGSGETAARWNADSFNANQYAEITYREAAGSIYIGVAVRIDTGGAATYYGYYSSGSSRYFFKSIGGSADFWGSLGPLTDGDRMRLEVAGDVITPKINGIVDTAIGGPHTDSSISAGVAGICGYGSGAGVTGDDWSAGNLSAAPYSIDAASGSYDLIGYDAAPTYVPTPPPIQEPSLWQPPRMYLYR